MKYYFFFLIFFIFPLYSFQVRVLLAKQSLEKSCAVQLECEGGFVLSPICDKTCVEQIAHAQLIIEARKNGLWVNGRKLAVDGITISSTHPTIPLTYTHHQYKGFFIVVKKGDELLVINSIDLEEYVCCVIRWEGWPGWPLEVNKVFAITCRSYVVEKIMHSRAQKQLYDIKCTNLHQTYKGTHNFDVLQQAVDETRGIIMTYKKKPIKAMYDSCCGGIIPAHLKAFDFTDAPYLARNYACTFCKECKLYSWKAIYPITDFEQLLEKELKSKVRIKDIKVSKKDKANVVHEITVRTPRRWHTLTSKKIYSLCKEVRSFCFSVKKHENHIVFEGKGYGHQVGLCQWGAWRMVKKGWDCRRILRFFYCDISFMHIEEALKGS